MVMKWEVEYTDDFGEWWNGLREDEHVPIADRLYDKHLETLRKEGLKDGS